MKLTKNSVSIVENIVDFTCALVFKDEVKAFEMETQESAVNASEYLSAYLKTDTLSENERKRIIDNYTEKNEYYKNLLDDYGIEPHISRLAKDLDIIHQPEKMILTHSYLHYYRAIYKQCLQSFYVTSYSPAMVTKDNYREFCLLSINLMAFVQLLNRWLENPYDINLMTEYQIDKFMISFGVSFFTGLPFKYKQIIARNLNRLIINKGTDKVVIDILELFGFAEININKYYLIRQAVTTQDSLNDNLDYREVNDFDVYFISHNINLPSLNHAIKNDLYTKYSYEQIVASDEYWNVTKEEVKSLDFNFVETKYFSIDTGFNLNVEVMNTTFIINLLKRIRTEYETKEKLEVLSNIISETIPAKVEDIIITLQILMCEYQGLEDNIQYDLAGIAKTYEFAKYDPLNLNLELMTSVPKINNLEEITLADLRTFSRFDEPSILSIYKQNIKVKDNLVRYISNETNYQDYKKLRSAHNAKFYQAINYNMFGTHPTFTSYLKTRNTSLYNIISSIRSISDTSEKNKTLENMISNLTDIITDTLQNFSIFLGATSLDILLSYMRTAILAFKSFTTSLLDLNVFIIVADTYETRLMDSLERMTTFCEHRADLLQFEDTIKLRSKLLAQSKNILNERLTKKAVTEFYERPLQPTVIFDKVKLNNRIFFKNSLARKDDYRINMRFVLNSKITNTDKILAHIKLHQKESFTNHLGYERLKTKASFRKNTLVTSFDNFFLTSQLKKSESLKSTDGYLILSRHKVATNFSIRDYCHISSKILANSRINYKEELAFRHNTTILSKSQLDDSMRMLKNRFFSNKIKLTDVYINFSKLNITGKVKNTDRYNTRSYFTEVVSIGLTDTLFFHTKSVNINLLQLPILSEKIKMTIRNTAYSDTIDFISKTKFKTALDVQSKNYLNDNCIITQVTYT